MPRSSDCKAYRQCLDRAALLDIPLQYPCPNYQRKPEPASWRDVYACELLSLAVTWPEAFEVFQAIRQAGDRREKWAVLRAAVPRLAQVCQKFSLWANLGPKWPGPVRYHADIVIGGCSGDQCSDP